MKSVRALLDDLIWARKRRKLPKFKVHVAWKMHDVEGYRSSSKGHLSYEHDYFVQPAVSFEKAKSAVMKRLRKEEREGGRTLHRAWIGWVRIFPGEDRIDKKRYL